MKLNDAMAIINAPDFGWRVMLGTYNNGELKYDYFPELDEPPIDDASEAFRLAVLFEAKSPRKYDSVTIEQAAKPKLTLSKPKRYRKFTQNDWGL